MESRILREQQGFSGEFQEGFFTGGAAGVEDWRDVPVEVRAWGDQVAVHRPVVVLAQRQTVGRVIVVTIGKGDEMGGVDEGDVVAGGEFDAQAAGSALVVVDFEDLAAEGGRAAVFERLVGDEGSGLTIGD